MYKILKTSGLIHGLIIKRKSGGKLMVIHRTYTTFLHQLSTGYESMFLINFKFINAACVLSFTLFRFNPEEAITFASASRFFFTSLPSAFVVRRLPVRNISETGVMLSASSVNVAAKTTTF